MYFKTAERKKDVKCPKCQTPLVNVDSYEVDYEDDKSMTVCFKSPPTWTAKYCHNCNTFYFDHITEPEQMVDGVIED